MKRLILIRHAKSSWDQLELADKDRPLNARGLKNAPMMGEVLRQKGIHPDRIFSSPAVRARSTAELIADRLDYPTAKIGICDELYMTGPECCLGLVHQMSPQLNEVCLVFHNPDITLLGLMLSDSCPLHLPTCSCLALDFEVDEWAFIMPNSGRLHFYEYPKKYA